jgi:hypothetical protein
MTDRVHQPLCALCMLEGFWSAPIKKGWDGIPICREHAAKSIAKASGQPVVTPTIDHANQSASLH